MGEGVGLGDAEGVRVEVDSGAVRVGAGEAAAGCPVGVGVGEESGASTIVAGPTTGVIGGLARPGPSPGGRISSHNAKMLPAKSASSDPR